LLHEFEGDSAGLPHPGDASANACAAVEAVAQIVADHGDAVAAAAVAASERACARLPVCSCGSHPTSHCVGARRGRQCAECPTVIPHRRAGWLCVGCDSFRCPPCRSKLVATSQAQALANSCAWDAPSDAAGNVQMAVVLQPPQAAASSQRARRSPRGRRGRRLATDGGSGAPASTPHLPTPSAPLVPADLATALDELPPAFARPPAMWIPRPVARRVSECFLVLMERALDAETASGSDRVAAHKLLKVAGQLLLRVDAPGMPCAYDDAKSPTLTSRVRDRLALAE
jgi:hypothetical protein